MGVVHPPLRRARRRRPARLRVGRGRAARRSPAPARSTWSTASCSCSRRGRCATLRFDESLGALHGYDVDFCLQARAAGRKVVTADFRADPQPLARAGQRPRGLGRGAHRGSRRSGTGRIPGATRGRPDWRAIARRARAEAEAARAAAVSQAAAVRRPRARVPARARRDRARASAGASPQPLRRANHWRRRARAALRRGGASRSQRAADLVLRHDRLLAGDAGAVAQAREPLGERERARVEQPLAARACGAPRAAARSAASHELDVRLGEVEDAVGLEPREQRVAVPRARAPRRPRRPTARRRSRRRRGRRTPARSPAAGPRARRRSPRRRSARRCAARPRARRRRGRAGRRSGCPGSSGCSPPPSWIGWRCSAGIWSAS